MFRRCVVLLFAAFAAAQTVHITLVSSLSNEFAVASDNSVALVANDLGADRVKLTVRYVLPDTSADPAAVGQFNECIRRLIIQRYFPEKLPAYIVSRYTHLRDTLWDKDAYICGIPAESVRVLQKLKWQDVYRENESALDSLGRNFPRVFINGRQLFGWGGDYPTLKLVVERTLSFGEGAVYRCFSDIDCFTPIDTLRGRCSFRPSGGVCVYEYAFPVKLYILRSSNPFEPVPANFLQNLRFWFPRLEVVELDPQTPDFKNYIDLIPSSYNTLPIYILSSNAELDASFPQIAHMLTKVDTLFVFNRPVISEYVENEEVPHRVDVFVAPMCPYSLQFERLFFRDFVRGGQFVPNDSVKAVNFHIMIKSDGVHYHMLHGQAEVEEVRRQLVVRQFFADRFFDYLRCRAENIQGDWTVCAQAAGIDTAKLRELVSQKSDSLIREEIEVLSRYIVDSTPTFIYKNKYRFNSLKDFAKMIGWHLEEVIDDGQCYY